MKLFQKLMVLGATLLIGAGSLAQDSSQTLSAEQLVQVVRQYHPIALQADNAMAQARAGVTTARRFFDPVLEMDAAEKVFESKQYYRYTQPQIVIPTWYGIELYAGTENLGGARVNPEETTGRTSYAGIRIPLLKNLLLDKRRATLQQAKILQQQSEVEKRMALNDLLHEALNSYWTWVQQHLFKNTIDRLIAVNQRRLELVKTSHRLGERAAIDTVEALVQLQLFLSLQQEQNLALQNAAIELSSYLWTSGSEPYLLPADVQPTSSSIHVSINLLTATDSLLQAARAEHPTLQQYTFKRNFLEVEQRLKFQSLLPKLDVKYNQLGKGYNVAKTVTAPLLAHNYRYGISFSVPLRLSEGRGEYRAAKLKLKSAELDRAQKAVQIENKVKAYTNKLKTLQAQLAIQQQVLDNVKALQRAEELRFFSGESSLFLINSRENKVLEAEQKLIEMQIKLAQTNIDLQWAAGTLHRQVNL